MMKWFNISLLIPFTVSLALTEERPTLADLPVGITSFGAAFHDGAIYMYGGQLGPAHQYSRDEVSKPLYRLKYSNDAKWEKLPSDEPALGPSLLSHQTGLIRIGGMQPRNAKGEQADMVSVPYVRRFDPNTGSWSALPDLPQGRSSHDAWTVGDKIYVAGGWEMRGEGQSSLWSKTVEVIDLSAEQPSWRRIPAPFFRRALAVVVYNHELYCIGGLDNGGEISREIDILNLKTEQWRKGSQLPDQPMNGFGTAAGIDASSGKLFLTGFTGSVFTYDGDWSEIGTFKHGRMFGRFVDPPNAPLLILGGAEKGGRPKVLEFVPAQ